MNSQARSRWVSTSRRTRQRASAGPPAPAGRRSLARGVNPWTRRGHHAASPGGATVGSQGREPLEPTRPSSGEPRRGSSVPTRSRPLPSDAGSVPPSSPFEGLVCCSPVSRTMLDAAFNAIVSVRGAHVLQPRSWGLPRSGVGPPLTAGLPGRCPAPEPRLRGFSSLGHQSRGLGSSRNTEKARERASMLRPPSLTRRQRPAYYRWRGKPRERG